MPNKFQKSVLERLEQDAVTQRKISKTAKKEKPEAPIPIEKHKIKETPIIEEVTAISEEKPVAPMLPDISDYLRKETTRLAKNKTFYLDADVIEAIKANAKNQQVTDSKLVNDILRGVLKL